MWKKATQCFVAFGDRQVSMNILQVIPQLDAGGAERTTLEVAEAITASGGRALVASQGGRLESELAACGGQLVRLPMASKNPFTLWRNTGRLVHLIQDEQIDIVHARSRAPAWSAKWAADRTDAHFVTTYHGTYNSGSSLKRRYNSVMARGERVIANSQFIEAHVRAEHPFAADRITVIPRGVDFDRFDLEKISEDRLDALASAWSIERNQTRLLALFPARLTGWKGQREMLRAMGLLKSQGVALPLVIFAGDAQGRTAYVDELNALISGLALHDDVRLVGHCDDMPAALALSDLVLTPSVEPEAFGRTAAEAGAMHRPVIACDHGGAREVIEAGVTGWRVQPGNVNALASALAEVIAMTPEQRATMGQAACNYVTRRFSTRSLQAATLRLYREILDCAS
jgi:glycosyltransferase involved in cell wall biosynthesis